MAKEYFIEMSGALVKLLSSAIFRVTLENDYVILDHTLGKACKNRLRVLACDTFVEEMTPYNLSKVRIGFRFKLAGFYVPI